MVKKKKEEVKEVVGEEVEVKKAEKKKSEKKVKKEDTKGKNTEKKENKKESKKVSKKTEKKKLIPSAESSFRRSPQNKINSALHSPLSTLLSADPLFHHVPEALDDLPGQDAGGGAGDQGDGHQHREVAQQDGRRDLGHDEIGGDDLPHVVQHRADHADGDDIDALHAAQRDHAGQAQRAAAEGEEHGHRVAEEQAGNVIPQA